MSKIDVTGGCHCRAIRYRITAEPIVVAMCHCCDCRVNAGAHAVAWIHIPKESYTITQGTPKQYNSSLPVLRTFCGDCGTTLTYEHASYEQTKIDVTLGSLDDPETFKPTKVVFEKEKLSWASAI